ncbi:MAG: hypothetical protein HZB62_07425 [Nitrospirae bacterium]|nr:hypothetical protein [Nitrospirota bacterium]
MKRTTIFADDSMIEELKSVSRRESKSLAETVREAMSLYLEKKRPDGRKLSFVAIGKSGRKNVAERHEELLWKKRA